MVTAEVSTVEAVENRHSVAILPFVIQSFPPSLSQVYKHDGQPADFDGDRINNGSVSILNPTRADSGNYSLTVINARGESTASILLSVHCETLEFIQG